MSGIDQYTKLLLHCDGANGSTVFPDDSTSNHIVTANGNAQVVANSVFDDYLHLDGVDDYITIPDSPDWNFGVGNFVIEGWVRTTETIITSYKTIIGQVSGVSAGWADISWAVTVSTTSNVIRLQASNNGGSGIDVMGTTDVTTLGWFHFAIVRSGNVFRVFVNGVEEAQGTMALTILNSTYSVFVGTGYSVGQYLYADIDEIRISKGTDRGWTTNFTPPTQPYTTDSFTKLLVHFDADSQQDVSAFGHTLTYLNGAGIGTFDNFYGNLSLGAVNSEVTIPDSTDWNFGSNNFTIELRVKFNVFTEFNEFINHSLPDGSFSWLFWWRQSSSRFEFADAGIIDVFATWHPVIHTWYHITMVRNGSNFHFYVDGVKLTDPPVTSSSVTYSVGKSLYIGKFPTHPQANLNIDELRISSISRYNADFTPPTQEFISDANTLLLCHFNHHDRQDVSSNNHVLTYGSGSIITGQSKFSNQALTLDGAGDYLSVADVPATDWTWSGDYTVDLWIYPTNLIGTNKQIIYNNGTGAGLWQLGYDVASSRLFVIYGVSTYYFTGSALTLNAWQHIEVGRSGSSTKLFIDGIQQGSVVTDSSGIVGGTNLLIGFDNTNYFTGKKDEIRVSVGIARHTANFTPPASPYGIDALIKRLRLRRNIPVDMVTPEAIVW